MEIKLDIGKRGKTLKTPWNFGVNTCHAILWTRDDLMNHAVMAAKNCGFRYVRFHNVISKHLNIYTEDEQGNPVINFDKFDAVFDNVAKCGYTPFFEVGFCPDALSRHTRDLCYYEADPSIPTSFEKWSYIIKKITEHCIQRYGIEYVKKWYFEVWNEPDLFYDGTMEDYFELYDYTVTAIKSVNGSLRVGGPATSKCLWIKEFINHIEQGSPVTGGKRIPCDFISTHAYPSDLAFLDSDIGDVSLQNSEIMLRLFKGVKELVENSSLKGIPVFMGEWNSSAGPFAENHDEKNNGAYIVKVCHDVKDIIDGSLFWNLSDIYEEQGFHYIPFHGGYGLININDIPKSSYNAFCMLNCLKGDEIYAEYGSSGTVRALSAFDTGSDELNVLLYYYCEPGASDTAAENIDLKVSGISPETVKASIQSLNDEHGSAYELWKDMGSPQFIKKSILEKLLEKSELECRKTVLFKNRENDIYNINLSVNPGDVILLNFKI